MGILGIFRKSKECKEYTVNEETIKYWASDTSTQRGYRCHLENLDFRSFSEEGMEALYKIISSGNANSIDFTGTRAYIDQVEKIREAGKFGGYKSFISTNLDDNRYKRFYSVESDNYIISQRYSPRCLEEQKRLEQEKVESQQRTKEEKRRNYVAPKILFSVEDTLLAPAYSVADFSNEKEERLVYLGHSPVNKDKHPDGITYSREAADSYRILKALGFDVIIAASSGATEKLQEDLIKEGFAKEVSVLSKNAVADNEFAMIIDGKGSENQEVPLATDRWYGGLNPSQLLLSELKQFAKSCGMDIDPNKPIYASQVVDFFESKQAIDRFFPDEFLKFRATPTVGATAVKGLYEERDLAVSR